MAIDKIDENVCTGCGICLSCCPQDVIRIDEKTGKAEIVYGQDCVACWACESFCPVGAIEVSVARPFQLAMPY